MSRAPDQPWILFDIGGVLEIVDDDTWNETLRASWAARLGLTADALTSRLRATDLPRIDIETGGEPEYWRRVGVALGADDGTVDRMRAEFWDAYCGEPNTELIAYARSLRDRAGVGILSNSADGAREEEERRYGFAEVFDPICYSHEQGVSKPEARAYELALQRMATTAQHVLFIDDHAEQLDGALRCGIRGVLHRDNASTIAAIEQFLAEREETATKPL
jgi:FMN phosphatase YigB (HAD superfamily)